MRLSIHPAFSLLWGSPESEVLVPRAMHFHGIGVVTAILLHNSNAADQWSGHRHSVLTVVPRYFTSLGSPAEVLLLFSNMLIT